MLAPLYNVNGSSCTLLSDKKLGSEGAGQKLNTNQKLSDHGNWSLVTAVLYPDIVITGEYLIGPLGLIFIKRLLYSSLLNCESFFDNYQHTYGKLISSFCTETSRTWKVSTVLIIISITWEKMVCQVTSLFFKAVQDKRSHVAPMKCTLPLFMALSFYSLLRLYSHSVSCQLVNVNMNLS